MPFFFFEQHTVLTRYRNPILLAAVSRERSHCEPIFYMRHRTILLAGVNAFILIVTILGVNGP